ncbi:MAG: hypothetical protein SWO11_03770 [Thermodesulfobacteriota bacterium]|nr:hypothetical protein [Thermodesulfobacteriota bacterium]
MGKRLLYLIIVLTFICACARESEVKISPREVNLEMKRVDIKIGKENILSDRLLIDKKLSNIESTSGWLKLFGINESKKTVSIRIPDDTLLATVPKVYLMVTFGVTNPNHFDIIISSLAFGLSEETIIFFPAKAKTEEVWIDVLAGETTEFEVAMTILKIPSIVAIAWPAIEKGTAEWKARGTMVIISKELPSGGLRQRFETGKIKTTLIKNSVN